MKELVLIKKILFILLLTYQLVACGPARYTVMNKGVAGNTSRDLLARVQRDVIDSHPDVVIVLAGTNDMVNSKKFISYEEFSSNFRALLEGLTRSHAHVIVLSPLPVDTAYLFQRHDRNAFTELPNTKLQTAGKILSKLAEEYGAVFVDLYPLFEGRIAPEDERVSLVLNENNSGRKDGVHPTREGYELIANSVFRMLQEKKLLKKNRRIVCFGDSITYGAFMEGEGTSEGDTYPAKLKDLISRR